MTFCDWITNELNLETSFIYCRFNNKPCNSSYFEKIQMIESKGYENVHTFYKFDGNSHASTQKIEQLGLMFGLEMMIYNPNLESNDLLMTVERIF